MSVTLYLGDIPFTECMNLSNANWHALMRLVDFDGDPICDRVVPGDGRFELLDFQVSFTFHSMSAMPELDGGRPSSVNREPGQVTIIDCGLREGYWMEKLSEFMRYLRHARELNLPLRWA